MLRLKGKFFNYSLINGHTPTEESEDEQKEDFYETLENVYDKCPKNDIKILLGDFNAQVGQEDIYYPTIGRHSKHNVTNDNGKRLILFATSRNMTVGSTLFPHKVIHKVTWRSPDGNIVNQIDHILIDGRHKSNLMDVRTLRGFNIDSDHFLVMANVRARISNAKKNKKLVAEGYNIEALNTPGNLELYRQEFKQVIEQEVNIENTIEGNWRAIKTAIDKAAKSILGNKTPKQRN